MRIWVGDGREPFFAEECLDLFWSVILLREQSLTVSRKQSLTALWNQKKCCQTCDPTNGIYSAVLMKQDLHATSNFYLPWNEAYKHSLSFSSHLFSMPCREGKNNWQHFFINFFIKRLFCLKTLCLLDAVCNHIQVQDQELIPTRLGYFHVGKDFWVQYFFPSNLICILIAYKNKLVLMYNLSESWHGRGIHAT